MTIDEFKNKYKPESAVGWEYIDKQLSKIYGQQIPRHFRPHVSYIMGGNDPLDGTSIYDNNNQTFHRHLISYGMSELYYNEESVGKEFSKYGFEFTFRVAPFEEDKDEPFWAQNVMKNLASYVLKSGRWFEEFEFIPTNGPIRIGTETDIVGAAFCIDPELGKISTPYGEVSFLQIVGITTMELKRLQQNPDKLEVEKLINKLRVENPFLITDLKRKN